MATTPNREETVVKTTQDQQIQTDGLVQLPEQQVYTAEEITFINLVAKGYSLTTAYRKAYPAKRNLSYETIRAYASRLYANSNISTEVATKRENMARLARLSEDRLEQILIEDDSMRKGSRVADVAMFLYDHANGKAKQSTEIISKSVSVNIDLTGSLTETNTQ